MICLNVTSLAFDFSNEQQNDLVEKKNKIVKTFIAFLMQVILITTYNVDHFQV